MTISLHNSNNNISIYDKWKLYPFVATNIMWDYIDSFRSLAIRLRPQGTKQYSKEIKDLYIEYTKWHKKQFNQNIINQENTLTETLIDNLMPLMTVIQKRVDEITDKRKKTYSMDEKWLIGSAFGATVFSKSVPMFEDDLRTKAEKNTGHNLKSNLPNIFKKASNVIETITNVLFPEYNEILTEYKYLSLKYLKEF